MNKKATFLIPISLMMLIFILSSCSSNLVSEGVGVPLSASPTLPTTQSAQPAEDDDTAPTEPSDFIEAVASRTPLPTATPSVIDRAVHQFTVREGLSNIWLLGLSVENWINIGVSILLISLAFLFGGWLSRSIIKWITNRSGTIVDDKYIISLAGGLRWMIVIWALHFSTRRLSFMNLLEQEALNDIIFILYLAGFVYLGCRINDFLINLYLSNLGERTDTSRMGGLVISVRRTIHVVILIIAGIILMDHFGLNITGITAAFGILGLAFSLAAKDALADAISGYIILFDQPFRVGDRIEIQELDTWGDVVDIGVRTTRIRTLNNRMVIIPNSIIGKNQVINLTYPDPRFVMSIVVSLAHGTNVDEARKIIHDTVRNTEGVLEDKPVKVFYIEIGETAMQFRVIWWIKTFHERLISYDRVNSALQEALGAAGIETPYPTYHVLYEKLAEETANDPPGLEED
jgi:small-conductance mechanosensitive channel